VEEDSLFEHFYPIKSSVSLDETAPFEKKPSLLPQNNQSLDVGSQLETEEMSKETQPLLVGGGGGGRVPFSIDEDEGQRQRKVKRRDAAGPVEDQGGAADLVARVPSPLHRNDGYVILTKKGQTEFDVIQRKNFENVSFGRVRRFLEAEGFSIKRVSGGHVMFHKQNGDYFVNVPKHDILKRGTLKDGILGKKGLQLPEAMAR
jgi:predicted RNA binding protein YcfA (HicA-like mRNA interferase family)